MKEHITLSEHEMQRLQDLEQVVGKALSLKAGCGPCLSGGRRFIKFPFWSMMFAKRPGIFPGTRSKIRPRGGKHETRPFVPPDRRNRPEARRARAGGSPPASPGRKEKKGRAEGRGR